MWSNTRAVLAVISLMTMTGIFLGIIRSSLLATWQFMPAVLAGSMLTAGLIILMTLLFGRVYCSIFCPLGILQDAVNYLSAKRKAFHRRFHYQEEKRVLRYGVLAALAAASFIGAAALPVLLDPYSIYGRLVTHIVSPVYQQISGALALMGEEYGYFSFARPDFVWQGLSGLLLAVIYLAAIGYAAWRWGSFVLQYDLSGWYFAGYGQSLRAVSYGNQCRKMRILWFV